MTKPLYELTIEHRSLMDALVESDGELTPELEDKLQLHEGEMVEKVNSLTSLLDLLKCNEAHWKNREKQCKSIHTALKNAQKRITERVKYQMEAMDVTELQGDDFNFKIQKNGGKQALDVDEEILPAKWFRTEYVPDNERIRAALESGDELIEGAALVPRGTSCRVKPNTRGKK